MQKIDLYRQYARQAIEAAEIATSKYEKADLLQIAEAWQQLASQPEEKEMKQMSALG